MNVISQKKIDTTRFHVVLLPKKECREQLVHISHKLNQTGSNVIELGDDMIPHITLYEPEIFYDNYEVAISKIEKLSRGTRKITIPFSEYIPAPRGDGGLFVVYKQTKELQHMRKAVIDVVNPIRGGVVRAKWDGNTDFACEIEKYGYPLSQYHFPHITLAKFTSQETLDKALEEMQEVEVGDFEARSIAVVETGEHGTAKRIVKEFVLE